MFVFSYGQDANSACIISPIIIILCRQSQFLGCFAQYTSITLKFGMEAFMVSLTHANLGVGVTGHFTGFFQRLDNAYRLYLFTLFITTKLYVVRRTPRYFAT